MKEQKSKQELFEDKKNKITLDNKEYENMKFAKMRHEQNEATFDLIVSLLKAPYYIFFKLPIMIYKKITFKSTRIGQQQELEKQQKETERLKRVIESKARALQKRQFDNVIHWDNSYLVQDGIFNIGLDEQGQVVTLDFNKFANLLVGGLPGGGKSKLIQLIAYQAMYYGAKVHMGDFKGGLDSQKFENKCNIVTEQLELLKLLEYFKKEIEKRIELFLGVGAENLKEYNEITGKQLKREYLIIDELGEALEIDIEEMEDKEEAKLKKQIEKRLRKLARLGRALGLNIVAGTQRPDVKVLEGQTRSMFGCRVCFQADKATSQIVIDSNLADELPETPGRAIVKKRKDYTTIQVFKFDTEMLKDLKNKKLTKEDLKVVNKNTSIENNTDIVDYDVD